MKKIQKVQHFPVQVSEGSEPPESLENVVDDGGGPEEIFYESEECEVEEEELVEAPAKQPPAVKAEPREEEAKEPPGTHFLDELLEEFPVSILTCGQCGQSGFVPITLIPFLNISLRLDF